jgi:cytochrome b pre-mRNA-processing protein 3
MLKKITSFFVPKPAKALAITLYRGVVAQARQPRFYRDLGVPDTLDGRFDMIILHAYLASRRLKAIGTSAAQELNQALFDLMFADMDSSLREIGVGDLSVGKKVKAMAQAFYGRVDAYDAGLAVGEEALAEALRRNLYGTVNRQGDTAPDDRSPAMAAYVRHADGALSMQADGDIMAGNLAFPSP